jgi:hypothetical protein
VLRHVVPLCLTSVIVRVTLDMSGIILTAAGLGFLGMGAQPPTPEWGTMIAASRAFILDQWWVPTIPGVAIACSRRWRSICWASFSGCATCWTRSSGSGVESQNTLPQFLATEKPGGSVLVQFDADVYSATLFLLTTLWHHIPAYYFMFDEFVPSEVVAFYDFSLAYPVEVEFLAARSDEYAQPGQVFGRLRNTAYQPPMTTGP